MKLDLETNRLLLRPFTMDDLDIALEMFTNTEIAQYIGGAISEEKVLEEMPKYVQRSGNGCIGVWCVVDKISKEKLGTAILLPIPIKESDTDWNLLTEPDIPDGDIEIGYVFKKSAWGKGYATEACKRLLKFAFEESPLTEVVATFDDPNSASRHVLLKSGLKDRGRRFCYGEANCPDFRITKNEWQQTTGT